MSDTIISVIRTVVPTLVGALVVWLADLGINVSDETSASLSLAAVGVVTAVYYWLVRLAEQKWPAAGWLLGVAKKPEYAPIPRRIPDGPIKEGAL